MSLGSSTWRRISRRGITHLTGVLAVILLASSSPSRVDLHAAGVISGIVFQDFNGNGIQDLGVSISTAGGGTTTLANDRGIAGITIIAVDSAGVTQGSATTLPNGSYSLSAGGAGPYRIEFAGFPAGFFPGPHGTQNGTTVQFVPDGNSASVNLGLVRATDHSQNNPELVTSIYTFGDQISGPNANQPVLVSFPYNSGAADGTPIPPPGPQPGGSDSNGGPYLEPTDHSPFLLANQVGTTWGLAYDRISRTVYAAAFTKKYAGYGPSGNGAIYQAGGPAGVGLFADLNQIFGAGTAGVDFRGTPTWIVDGGFFADGGNTGWDAVGKSSLGGMDISDDGGFLYVMNLADRSLYILPTTGPLNSTTVRSVLVPNPGIPDIDFRPFAVTFHAGQVYVGAINSAESTQNPADVTAYVFLLDPVSATFNPTPILQFDLDFPRGIGNAFAFLDAARTMPVPGAWQPWTTTFKNRALASMFVDPGSAGDTIYPQPWLTGLAFDADGNMVLGIRDRTGDQVGVLTPDDPSRPGELRRGIAIGDTLRAAFDPGLGTFALETNGTVGGNTSAGAGNNQGPGSGEFYFEDFTPLPPGFATATIHDEMSVGGVLQIPGFPDVATTTINPILVVGAFSRGGVRWFDNATGAITRAYEAYYSGPVSTSAITFSKANGVGDLLALVDPAPLEIGNRVWVDSDADGIQDAGEPGIAGVTVGLYSPGGVEIGSAVTNAAGEYFFSNAAPPAGPPHPSAAYGITGLTPNTAGFTVRLDDPANYAPGGPLHDLQLTTAGVGPDRAIDSNGVPSMPTDVRATFDTGGPGENDHTIDFGWFGADIEVQKVLVIGNPPGGQIDIREGEPYTFWLKVINHGPAAATNVVVRDVLPMGVEVVSYVASQGTLDATTGVWTVGSLAIGGVAQLDITVIPRQPGPRENRFERVSSSPGDPNSANDVSTATFNVQARSDIAVRGVFVPSLLTAHTVDATNPTVTMRFEVRNPGLVPMAAIRVQAALRAADDRPALTITSARPSQGTIDATAGAWDVGPLAPGASATIEVTATVTRAVRMYAELSRATTTPADGDPANDRAVLTVDGVTPNSGGPYVAFGNTSGTATGDVIVGAGELAPAAVQLFDRSGARTLSFAPYDPRITGGVRVAACDLNADGRDEIVTAAGLPDGGPHVRVFSRSGGNTVSPVAGWYAIDPQYRGGVYVACGDVDGDGVPEVVTGTGAEGSAVIQIWKPTLATGGAQELKRGALGDILPGFGVRVATCDLTGDGRAEIIATAPGGSAPLVRIFDVATARLLHAFPAAGPGETVGLQVACGDILPGGGNEIVVGLELGGSPIARAFTPVGAVLGEYLGFAPTPGASVRVAIGEFDGDPTLQEFALATGLTGGPQVLVGSARAGVTILLRLTP